MKPLCRIYSPSIAVTMMTPIMSDVAFLTYKYRLKGRKSACILRQHAIAVNQVWNYCAETQKRIQRRRKDGITMRWPSGFDLCNLTRGTSADLGIHAQTIQNVCDRFAKSRDQHQKCPRWRKSYGSGCALGWVPFTSQSRRVDANFVRYRGHTFKFFGAKRRPLPEAVKSGAFVEDARGSWWVCLTVEVPNDQKCGIGSVGIDLGLANLAAISDGRKIEASRTYRRWEERLAIAQRARRKNRVRAIHAKIANVRRDHHHKLSTQLVREHGAIYVGNVSSSSLARTRLSKSVTDAGWSSFRNMLRYKASRHGAHYAEVDEKFTSQTCSSCGALPSTRPRGIAGLGIREWECSACGTSHDRDVNAARNILALGLSAQPPAEGSWVASGGQSISDLQIGTNRPDGCFPSEYGECRALCVGGCELESEDGKSNWRLDR